jgi:hypothetical protein
MAGARSRWMRWPARALGTLAAAWWLFIGVAEITVGHTPWSAEGALLGALIVVNALGTLIAWFREEIGGAILALGGGALCLFAYLTAGHNRAFAVLVSGAPFLIAGILFLTWSGGLAPRQEGGAPT